ncbi:hypothetical protein ACQPYE_33825 [Actinosynnema sp. CA-299493]
MTGSYVVRRPPVCSSETTARSATGPACTTTASAAARTAAPAGAARSTPRWPGPYSVAGASKARTTWCGGASGQAKRGGR